MFLMFFRLATACRYPEEWAERRAEDKARVKQLQCAATTRNQQMLHSRNAYELLFSI